MKKASGFPCNIFFLIDAVVMGFVIVGLSMGAAHYTVSPRDVLKVGLLLVGMTLFGVAFMPTTTRPVLPEKDIDE